MDPDTRFLVGVSGIPNSQSLRRVQEVVSLAIWEPAKVCELVASHDGPLQRHTNLDLWTAWRRQYTPNECFLFTSLPEIAQVFITLMLLCNSQDADPSWLTGKLGRAWE